MRLVGVFSTFIAFEVSRTRDLWAVVAPYVQRRMIGGDMGCAEEKNPATPVEAG